MSKLFKQYKYLVSLRFIWHSIDVVEKDVTFWPIRYTYSFQRASDRSACPSESSAGSSDTITLPIFCQTNQHQAADTIPYFNNQSINQSISQSIIIACVAKLLQG